MDLQNKITGLNMELFFIIDRLKDYKTKTNAIDKNTGTKLLDLVNTIHWFLDDTQLQIVEFPNEKITQADFACQDNSIDIHRSFFCNVCKRAIISNKISLSDHLKEKFHQHKLKIWENINSLDNKKNEICSNSNSYLNVRSSDDKPNGIDRVRPRRNLSPALSDVSNITNRTTRTVEDASSQSTLPSLRELLPLLQSDGQKMENRPLRSKNEPGSTNGKKKFKENICREAKSFLTQNNLTEVVIQMVKSSKALTKNPCHKRVMEDLEYILRKEYAKVKIYMFGSRMIGLGNKSSDLDIFVDTDNLYHCKTKPDDNYMKEVINNVENLLKNYNVWQNIEIISARTPLIRVWNKIEKIDCDISFTNGLGHRNTLLIEYFLKLQPVFMDLCVFLKHWAKVSVFAKMNSYNLYLMIIFYLQTENVLPSVARLQENVKPVIIYNWNSSFKELTLTELKIEKCNDFKKHAIGFFMFYASKFSLEDFAVCPLVGYGLKKTDFAPENIEALPKELHRYIDYMKNVNMETADAVGDLFAYDRDMVIQDPLDLIHNVAKGLKPSVVNKFVGYCKLSLDLLRKNKQF